MQPKRIKDQIKIRFDIKTKDLDCQSDNSQKIFSYIQSLYLNNFFIVPDNNNFRHFPDS